MKTAILLKGETLGDGDDLLGRQLMGTFLRKLWNSKEKPDSILFYNSAVRLLASGSEVQPALAAHQKLKEEGIFARLVSMPSWELFENQPEEYKNQVIPREIPLRVSIEAGATLGWHKYVGPEGEGIGIDHFGASAPVKVILEKFGFTPENIMRRVKALLARRAQR